MSSQSTTQGDADKRQFIRLPFEAKLSIQIGNKQTHIEGICMNMSAGGILVATAVPVAVDTEIKISLQEAPEKFSATGHVVRLVEDAEKFLVAVSYAVD